MAYNTWGQLLNLNLIKAAKSAPKNGKNFPV
jgi:hypothetical protein